MKKFNLKYILLLIICAVTSCGQETATSTSSTSENSTDSTIDLSDLTTVDGCPAGRTGNEAGVATDGQTIDYYTIPYEDVVMHGASDGIITFNSQLHLPSEYQNLLRPDSRLNVRIIPREVSKGTLDSQGNLCTKQGSAWPFTELNLKMVIRSSSGTAGIGESHYFQEVPIDCASEVHEFSLESIASNDPLVIEIMNATNDQDCLEDQTKTGRQDYCPYHTIGSSECYGVEIQFSTDSTKDIPH